MSKKSGTRHFLTVLVVHPDAALRQKLFDLYFQNLRDHHIDFCCRLSVTIHRANGVDNAIEKFKNGLDVDVVVFSDDLPVAERNRVRDLLSSLDKITPFKIISLRPSIRAA